MQAPVRIEAFRPVAFYMSRPIRRVTAVAIAGVAALSLMLASALPAQAQGRNDDLAKALIAAIAIGAVIHTIDKNNKRRAQPAPQPAPLPAPVHQSRTRLPDVCAIEIAGSRRSATVYPERCLRREGIQSRLPRQCSFEARIFGRTDTVYSEDCLLDAGFRLGRGPSDRRPHDRWDRRQDGWDHRERGRINRHDHH